MRRQVAALCHRDHAGRREVLLITSRERGRWIVPKGWPMEDRSDAEAARIEAWEEAGVEAAEVSEDVLGAYFYEKRVEDGEDIPVEAQVYEVEVAALAEDYPEREERERVWVTPEEAARRVDEPELQEILRDFGADD